MTVKSVFSRSVLSWGMPRILALVVFAALCFMASSSTRATDRYPDKAAAMAACQADVAKTLYPDRYKCDDQPNKPANPPYWQVIQHEPPEWTPRAYYSYLIVSCSEKPSYPGSYGDNISVCRSGCMYAPQSGGTTDTVRSGSWFAQLRQTTYVPTGATCDSSALPEPPTKNPTICGGGSCHDTSGHSYCAVDSGGAQFCVPEPTPGQPGGCASSGDSTLCAGNPPPIPGNPPVADPYTDISATDSYGHQDGNGAISNTTVNNYNNSGQPAQNGAVPGDSGDAPDAPNPKPGSGNDPASSSSSGAKGNGTTATGGGDCNTPPIVTGDAAAGAIAFQAWKTRCAVEKGGSSGLGTGTVGTLGELYHPSGDTVDSVVQTFQTGIKDAPVSAAVTGFFQVDHSGGSCPTWSTPESDWLPAQTFDFYCRPDLANLLDGARIVILIACAYAAFRIAFGDA